MKVSIYKYLEGQRYLGVITQLSWKNPSQLYERSMEALGSQSMCTLYPDAPWNFWAIRAKATDTGKTLVYPVPWCCATYWKWGSGVSPKRALNMQLRGIVLWSLGHSSQKKSRKSRGGMYCICTLPRGGMYWEIRPPRKRDFPRAGILYPKAREIKEGCKIPPRGSVRPFSQN